MQDLDSLQRNTIDARFIEQDSRVKETVKVKAPTRNNHLFHFGSALVLSLDPAKVA